jgi:hypothetical protein
MGTLAMRQRKVVILWRLGHFLSTATPRRQRSRPTKTPAPQTAMNTIPIARVTLDTVRILALVPRALAVIPAILIPAPRSRRSAAVVLLRGRDDCADGDGWAARGHWQVVVGGACVRGSQLGRVL